MGRILAGQLYEYIDAGETVEKSYQAFLVKIPRSFQGIAEINYSEGELELIERRSHNPWVFSLELGAQF